MHVRGGQHPKLRLTADTEDNRENCQCMSLNLEHPSKHVDRIIFLPVFWQAAVTGDCLESLQAYHVECIASPAASQESQSS